MSPPESHTPAVVARRRDSGGWTRRSLLVIMAIVAVYAAFLGLLFSAPGQEFWSQVWRLFTPYGL